MIRYSIVTYSLIHHRYLLWLGETSLKSGGVDGARTRDLMRDRHALYPTELLLRNLFWWWD